MAVKKQETKVEEEARPESSGPFYDLARKVLLAGLGAAALAQDEVESFVGRLAERGELAEKDAKKLMKEVKEKRDKFVEEKRSEWEGKKPAYATKGDIEALTQKVVELSKKLDELKKD